MKSNKLSACKYVGLGFLVASILFNHSGVSRGNIVASNNAIQQSKGNIPRGAHTGKKITVASENDNHQSSEDHSFSIEEKRAAPNSIKSINLIGERHSGTKWITQHLEECFGKQVAVDQRYTRWKHWFQYDDTASDEKIGREENYHPTKSSMVVAMFRDPYTWVNSMRKVPHHSPSHFDLDWKSFVTKPWSMPRRKGDKELIKSGSQYSATCLHRFVFNEAMPCSPIDRKFNATYHGRKKTSTPTYELNRDGSGQPYASIVNLRRDKIKNFLDVAKFHGVASFLPVRYEALVTQGTADFIKDIENATGLQAQPGCKISPPRQLSKKVDDIEFIEWMNEYIDWEVEQLIGYSKRDA